MSAPFHVSAAIPAELAAAARELAARIREHPRPEALRSEAVELVQQLTRSGLDAFFLAPVERMGLGVVTVSMVKVGLSSSARVICVAIGRIVGGLTAAQIRHLADLLDEIVVARPATPSD